jgi:hypothetical protein
MKIPIICLTTGTAILAIVFSSGALGAPTRGSHHSEPRRTAIAVPPPAAAEFARVLADTTTAYAKQNGDKSRVANVDCVQASRGHYMCSYLLIRPSLPRECHLLQATWSPGDGSLYAVTLAGRVPTCGTLKEALRSLR